MEKIFTVEIKNLTKKFGSTVAIDNLSLNIEKGKGVYIVAKTKKGYRELLNLKYKKVM